MDPNITGIILVGSLTYAPNHDVKANSDVDLVIVYDDDKFKDSASKYFSKEKADYIKGQDNLDGFMSKNTIDGVDVSLHVINKKALDKITSCNSQELRYYREKPKDFTYGVKDYVGEVYDFKPKTVPVKEVGGEIRVDNVSPPVSPNGPTIGNDMDKILSAGTVLIDDKKKNSCKGN